MGALDGREIVLGVTGSIAAFKAAGVDPVPPVSGNDATIAALQLIIAGDQYNTISKPSEIVAVSSGPSVTTVWP